MTGIVPVLLALIAGAVIFIVLMTFTGKKNKTRGAKTARSSKNRGNVIRDCTKKLSHDPHNIRALTELSDLYFSEQDYKKAFPLYESLYGLKAAHPEIDKKTVCLRYGICAELAGKLDEALPALLEAERASPNDFSAMLHIGKVCYARKDYEKAVIYLRKARMLNPDASEINMPLGVSLFQIKKYRDCLPILKRVLDENPGNKEVLFDVAVAMVETGYGAKALKVFMHLRTDPVFGAQACLEAGSIHQKMEQTDKAIQDYEIALKLENVPQDTRLAVCYKVANAYIAMQNISKGLYYLKQIQAVQPNYKDVPTLVQRYAELNQSRNLQLYIMSGPSEFVALCRKFVSGYYSDAFVKIEDVAVTAEGVDITAQVETSKWEAAELFRFFRSTGSVGELYVRDCYSKMRDIKCDRGLCVCAGTFTEEAAKYVEGRPIDLIGKGKLVTILKKLDTAG